MAENTPETIVEPDEIYEPVPQDSFAEELGKSVAITAATTMASVVVMFGSYAAISRIQDWRAARKARKVEETPSTETPDTEEK
jgi:hypothetical protein